MVLQHCSCRSQGLNREKRLHHMQSSGTLGCIWIYHSHNIIIGSVSIYVVREPTEPLPYMVFFVFPAFLRYKIHLAILICFFSLIIHLIFHPTEKNTFSYSKISQAITEKGFTKLLSRVLILEAFTTLKDIQSNRAQN